MNKSKKTENKIYILRNIIIIYNLILFVTTILQKYFIIKPFKNIYLIWLCTGIFWVVMLIVFGKLEKYTINNKIHIIIVLLSTGLFMTTYYSWIINGRANLIIFSKNAVKTEAYIYDIQKEIRFHYDTCPGKIRGRDRCYSINDNDIWSDAEDYYELYSIYYLTYKVNNKEYDSKYKDKITNRFKSKAKAANYELKDKKGDYIVIYYDKNNPKSIKRYIAKNYGIIIDIIGLFVTLFNIFAIFIFSKYIKNQSR